MYIFLLFWFEHHFYILSKAPVFFPSKMLHMKSKKSQQNNNNSNKTLIGIEGPLHEVHRFSDQELK